MTRFQTGWLGFNDPEIQVSKVMQTIHTMKIGLKDMYEDSPHKVVTFGAIYIDHTENITS